MEGTARVHQCEALSKEGDGQEETDGVGDDNTLNYYYMADLYVMAYIRLNLVQ